MESFSAQELDKMKDSFLDYLYGKVPQEVLSKVKTNEYTLCVTADFDTKQNHKNNKQPNRKIYFDLVIVRDKNTINLGVGAPSIRDIDTSLKITFNTYNLPIDLFPRSFENNPIIIFTEKPIINPRTGFEYCSVRKNIAGILDHWVDRKLRMALKTILKGTDK